MSLYLKKTSNSTNRKSSEALFALSKKVFFGAELRLAFSENLYQEQAALEMKISRATFGRILNLACQKVTDALLHSKAIQINNNDNQ